MTARQAKLRKLEGLTKLALEADLAKLRTLTTKATALREAFKELSPLNAALQNATCASDARSIENYRLWCERRRIEINQQLALVLAEITVQKSAARLTFGRNAVVEKLAALEK